MEPQGTSPRTSALAFSEGVRAGWLASDLIAWANEHLVLTGRLHLQRGSSIRYVREQGVGLVSVQLHNGLLELRTPVRTTSFLPHLLKASRSRVVEMLRSSIHTGQTGFVNAALYSGRVSRVRKADGHSSWLVWLSEDDSLSDQVLALFAADALTHPADYEDHLAVCDVCGAISFNTQLGYRRGCPTHPLGEIDGVLAGRGNHPSGRPPVRT